MSEGSGTSLITREKKGYSIFWMISSIILAILFVFSGLMNVVLGIMVATLGAPMELGEDYNKKVLETLGDMSVEDNKEVNQILVISLDGIITGHEIWNRSTILPKYLEKKLKAAQKDNKIKAVILKITSPGGEITASDKMYEAIKIFREKSKKPVIAYLDTMATSGGYYIAAGCDQIIAHPTCITGSIGVIFSFFQFHDLMQNKLGIQYTVIKSGASKDAGSFARAMTDSEKQIFQAMIDEMYTRFLNIVTSARPSFAKLPAEEKSQYADGRIFTATKACQIGLVDYVCNWNDAIPHVRDIAGIGTEENIQMVTYEQSRTFLQELLGTYSSHSPTASQEVVKIIEQYSRPQIYYLWLNH